MSPGCCFFLWGRVRSCSPASVGITHVSHVSCGAGRRSRDRPESRGRPGSAGPGAQQTGPATFSASPVSSRERICFSDLLFPCLVNTDVLCYKAKTNTKVNYSRSQSGKAMHLRLSPHYSHTHSHVVLLGVIAGFYFANIRRVHD